MAKVGKHAAHLSKKQREALASPFGSRTDIGCVREHNEDSLIAASPLFVVADGMGGHAAGEVASEIAVKTIAEFAPEHPDAEELGAAVEQANRDIINAALSGEGREGMGTTCTAAMLEGERLIIAQVGDSRAYLLHAGELIQLTRDHSLMANMIEAGQITPEQARYHPNRSVITRALGSDPYMVPDLYEINVEAGDRLLLCSDGLTSMLLDSEIQAIMNRVSDPQRCASQLVNEAIAAGGLDNVTVIVVNVTGKSATVRRRKARRTKLQVALIILLVLAVIGGAGYGGYQYLHHTAYLANDNGYVAIYRGVPGSVLGFSYSEHLQTTDIAISDLPPSAASRINENMRVGSVEEAEALVATYRADLEDARHVTVRPSSSAASVDAAGLIATITGSSSGSATSASAASTSADASAAAEGSSS